MHIGINGQGLLIENPAGVEVYTYNIINALSNIDTQNKYTLYFDKKPSEGYFEALTNFNPNFSYKVLPRCISWTQVSLAMELIRNPVDVFFTPIHTMPIVRTSKIKTVGMIHGLEYTYSAEYKNPIRKILVGKPEWYVCKFADAVIVPSEATKNAILARKWKVNPRKIMVIPEGVDSNFYKRSPQEIESVKERYGLSGKKYLLFVSTIQPRKNIPRMVEAFAKLSAPDLYLVIAGKEGWLYEESVRAPEKFGVHDKVLFLGRVPYGALPVLLSGAKALVNVSLEEGFGLPLLEAMACELPCLVSDIPAFKEVGADTVFYVDPRNVDAITRGMQQVLEASAEKVRKAKERSLEFTWEKTAQKTLKVL